MSGALAVDLIRGAVTQTLVAASPLLVIALVVGVVVSLVQTVTQLHHAPDGSPQGGVRFTPLAP